jgi:AraC-like DNA-binding protein
MPESARLSSPLKPADDDLVGPMVGRTRPVYEPIVPQASDTFLWRCDDYPQSWAVWNQHPEYEIHLIRKSQGVAFIGDHIGPFEVGYLAIVGSHLPHDWVTTTSPGQTIVGRDIVLQFDPKRIRKAAAELPELSKLDRLLKLSLRGLSFFGQTRLDCACILETIGSTQGVERLSLFLSLLHTMAASNEFDVLSSEAFSLDPDPDVHRTIQRILKRLVKDSRRQIRLSELAETVGMTESAFSRFFKRNTGNTFVKHLTSLRISDACDLLVNTDLPITEVCFEAGYMNVSNFNRAFRKQRGITPGRYRHLARQRHR